MSGFWYLASPYSDPDENVRVARFKEVAAIAIDLVRRGIDVFCPITHSHPMDLHRAFELREAERHSIWMKLDEPFMEAAVGLIVAQMPGWKESKGVAEEIERFIEMGKPIMYLEVDAG